MLKTPVTAVQPSSRIGPSAPKPDGIRARRSRTDGAALPGNNMVFSSTTSYEAEVVYTRSHVGSN